jgi:hypothetical protein
MKEERRLFIVRGIAVEVRVVDRRRVNGSDWVLIEPCTGQGSTWVPASDLYEV